MDKQLPEIPEKPPRLSGDPDTDNRTDQVTVRQVVNGRWPVTDRVKNKVMGAIDKALDSEDASVAMLAARTAIQADNLNIKERELEIKARPKMHVHTDMTNEELQARLTEVASSLGIDLGSVANPEAMLRGYLEQ